MPLTLDQFVDEFRPYLQKHDMAFVLPALRQIYLNLDDNNRKLLLGTRSPPTKDSRGLIKAMADALLAYALEDCSDRSAPTANLDPAEYPSLFPLQQLGATAAQADGAPPAAAAPADGAPPAAAAPADGAPAAAAPTDGAPAAAAPADGAPPAAAPTVTILPVNFSFAFVFLGLVKDWAAKGPTQLPPPILMLFVCHWVQNFAAFKGLRSVYKKRSEEDVVLRTLLDPWERAFPVIQNDDEEPTRGHRRCLTLRRR